MIFVDRFLLRTPTSLPDNAYGTGWIVEEDFDWDRRTSHALYERLHENSKWRLANLAEVSGRLAQRHRILGGQLRRAKDLDGFPCIDLNDQTALLNEVDDQVSTRMPTPFLLQLSAMLQVAGLKRSATKEDGVKSSDFEHHVPAAETFSDALDTYIVPVRCDDIRNGIYYYHPYRHTIFRINAESSPIELLQRALSQSVYESLGGVDTCLLIVVAGSFAMHWEALGERCYRQTIFEAGRLAERLSFAAGRVELAATIVEFWADDGVNRIIRANGLDESALACVLIREPHKGRGLTIHA